MKLRLVWTMPLVFLIAAPLGGYLALAHTTSSVIPDWVGGFGVTFSAREWDIDLRRLSVTARGVSISRDAASPPVLTAEEVVFDGNLRTITRGLFSPGAYYHHISVRRGELHLEQSRTGEWNWIDFIEAVPASRRASALTGLYQIDGLFLEDLDVAYIEHVPSGSTGEVLRTTTATVHIDDVTGSVTDLRRVPNLEERPTTFDVSARTAGGRVELRGNAALFTTPVRNEGGIEAPFFTMRIQLDALGMAALSQMLPTTGVQPVQGSISGKVNLSRGPTGTTCESEVSVSGLHLVANSQFVAEPAELARVNQDLSSFQMSGPYDMCRPLSTPTVPIENAHTLSALAADMNDQTTAGAPTRVRLLAALDQHRLAGVVAPAAVIQAPR